MVRRWEKLTGRPFRSTPPRRGDTPSGAIGAKRMVFRSTPPRRGDKHSLPALPLEQCFDPRPREGAT